MIKKINAGLPVVVIGAVRINQEGGSFKYHEAPVLRKDKKEKEKLLANCFLPP